MIVFSPRYPFVQYSFYFQTVLFHLFIPFSIYLKHVCRCIPVLRFTSTATASCCFHIMGSAEFEERFPTFPVHVKELHLLVHNCANAACSKMPIMITCKAARQKQLLIKSMFMGIGDAMLSDMGADHVQQCFAQGFMSDYILKRTPKVQNTSSHSLVTEVSQYQYWNGFRNKLVIALFSVLKYGCTDVLWSSHVLPCLRVVRSSVKCKDHRITQVYTTETLISIWVQLVWLLLYCFGNTWQPRLSNAVALYI